MNYFAHALSFLDQPYLLAGTAVPDWLMVVDRRVRLRKKQVATFCWNENSCLADTAKGVLQHLEDDSRFHNTRAFAETSLKLTVLARDALAGETGLRPSFLGHLLTEILLDATLIAASPERLKTYYRTLEQVDATQIQLAVNLMANHQTQELAFFIGLFRQERVLWDYLEDKPLAARLNQIMRRIRLEPLPDSFADMLPEARKIVAARASDLLP